ncbi:hypothetical protein GCM10017786_19080 [Amycolatopsis deserti]|uniref:Uncharacterized protein n=1 Tax=Amycolatopsis deserti TaxID=185696 RepID=A0ABQ3ILX2_9PSEU|nr:hypothetical protein GCM10017786_19080 [Amycolatopsis deserti]
MNGRDRLTAGSASVHGRSAAGSRRFTLGEPTARHATSGATADPRPATAERRHVAGWLTARHATARRDSTTDPRPAATTTAAQRRHRAGPRHFAPGQPIAFHATTGTATQRTAAPFHATATTTRPAAEITTRPAAEPNPAPRGPHHLRPPARHAIARAAGAKGTLCTAGITGPAAGHLNSGGSQ